MKFLSLPVPVLIGYVVQATPEGLPVLRDTSTMNVLIGAYIAFWLLAQVGKLPGQKVPAPCIPPEVVAKIDKVAGAIVDDHDTKFNLMHSVLAREDPTKPGWHIVWTPPDTEIKKLMSDHNKLMTMHLDQFRTINQRLDAIEKKLEA